MWALNLHCRAFSDGSPPLDGDYRRFIAVGYFIQLVFGGHYVCLGLQVNTVLNLFPSTAGYTQLTSMELDARAPEFQPTGTFGLITC